MIHWGWLIPFWFVCMMWGYSMGVRNGYVEAMNKIKLILRELRTKRDEKK